VYQKTGGAPQAVGSLPVEAIALADSDGALSRVAGFVQELRRHGVMISPAETADFIRAGMLTAPAGLYWCGRISLVSRKTDIPVYDQVFLDYFGMPDPQETVADSYSPGDMENGPGAEEDPQGEEGLASTREDLEHRDFSQLNEEESLRIIEELNQISFALPLRRVLRRKGARRGRVDVRTTVRRELRAARKNNWDVHRSVRKAKPKRLVLILDVSRSMSPYSRFLVVFAHALIGINAKVDVYCFSTRLTWLNEALSHRDVNIALDAVAELTPDRDSGTRIGEALDQLLRDPSYGRSLHGAVVAILSDGLEQGGVDMLADSMGRLSRRAQSVAWVNPLKGSEGYEPLQQGMLAALPHIDRFVEGHDLSSLRDLTGILADVCR